MYFISYKCIVGEVGSYCQLAMIFFFFWSHLTKPANVVPQFHFDPPFDMSGSAPVMLCCSAKNLTHYDHKISYILPVL